LLGEDEELHAGVSGTQPVSGQPFRGALIGGLILAVAAIFSGVGAVAAYSLYEQSLHTQASGVPDTATVTSVSVIGPHRGRQTVVTVQLKTPVSGQDVSQVTVPGAQNYRPGDRIPVVVDRQDPSFSGLPGDSANNLATPVILAVFAALLALTSALLLVKAIRALAT
jgi:hypothetical protein